MTPASTASPEPGHTPGASRHRRWLRSSDRPAPNWAPCPQGARLHQAGWKPALHGPILHSTSCQVLPPRASRSGPYGTGVSRTLPSWMSAGPVPLRLMSTPRSPWFQEHHSPPPKAPFSPDFLPRHQKTTTPQTQGQAAALPPPGSHTPIHWELLTQGPSKRQSASCLPSV